MSQSLKWIRNICFGLSAVLGLSLALGPATAGGRRSGPALPVEELLSEISEFEPEAQAHRHDEHVQGEGFIDWDPDLLPEASRSFLYYELSEESFEALEENVDEDGARLL